MSAEKPAEYMVESTETKKSSEYSLTADITGVDEAVAMQKEKLSNLREAIKTLQFKKIDPAGSYLSIAFSAIDGGKMRVNFNPFEINVIDVADSNENRKLSFVFPEIKNYGDYESQNGKNESLTKVIKKIDEIEIIHNFVKLLGKQSIADISSIINSSDTLMELAEWACIFDRVVSKNDDPIIILKDGLLRTKALKANNTTENYIRKLKEILKEKKKNVRLVGVSKNSSILSLLSVALFLEKKIPYDSIGYVKIPLSLELKAYTWSGKGRTSDTPLTFAFGELYIAKLAKDSNLLVTIEIPRDLEKDLPIYSDEQISEIISYLAKDSKFSYPNIGYPQTIMRAHEAAVQLGFTASIIKDEIRDKILELLDKDAKEFVKNGWLIMDNVDKGSLGGGNYGGR